jgi:hypothetical protein
MVTHSSTSRPVQCLCMAERTGCPVFTDLWSYVLRFQQLVLMYPMCLRQRRTRLENVAWPPSTRHTRGEKEFPSISPKISP